MPNLLNREFNQTNAPNQVWVTDITYIPTDEGWLYLAIVLDLYSRRVVSLAFSSLPNSELSVRALEVAVQHRRINQSALRQPLLFHSDQGVQYSSDAFRNTLNQHYITSSMSRRGNCHDNAVMERFFRSLKSERVN